MHALLEGTRGYPVRSCELFKILEQQHVPLEDLDSTLRKIASWHIRNSARRCSASRLKTLKCLGLRQQASQALETGDFAQVETLLHQAQARDLHAIQEQQASLKTRQLSAAATSAELGALKNIQLSVCSRRDPLPASSGVVPQDEALTQAEYLNC